MLVLALKRLDGGRSANFHNISLPGQALEDAKTQLLSVESLPTRLEGLVFATHVSGWH